MKKEFAQIQLALFFQADFDGQFENASLRIKEKFGKELTSQILGVPNSAPSEIPRLVVNSEKLNINFSKNRIDFFSQTATFITDNIKNIFSTFDELEIKIGRIGIVLSFFKESDIKELKTIFDSTKIASLNLNEANIRLNEIITVSGVQTNSSQMYASASATNLDGVRKNGLAITVDINTLPDDLKANTYTEEKVLTFAEVAFRKADETIF